MTWGISLKRGSQLTGHAVEGSPACRLQGRDQVERADARGLLCLGQVVFHADAADIADHAVPFADLAGEKNQTSVAFERNKIRHRHRHPR